MPCLSKTEDEIKLTRKGKTVTIKNLLPALMPSFPLQLVLLLRDPSNVLSWPVPENKAVNQPVSAKTEYIYPIQSF